MERFGGAKAFVGARAAELRDAGLKDDTVEAITRFDETRLKQDLDWLEAPGHSLLTWHDERYPSLLRNLSSPPGFQIPDPGLVYFRS